MIGDRIRKARIDRGLLQVDLAVVMGVGSSMISQVESGHRGLRLERAIIVARELGVSLDYLFGLTDDPTPADQHNDYPSGTEDEPIEDIEHLAEIAAAAGRGAQVYDETVTDRIPFRRSWLRLHRINPKHCHVIGVRGESMEPTLPRGSSIIVDRNRRELRSGRIYVMRTEEGLVVKRAKRNAQGWWLLSDNPEWAPLMLTEETDIVGEVRWSGRTF